MKYKNGTLLTWHSWGNTYYGFVIGTCSYDNHDEDNAYVMRYVFSEDSEVPRRPYAIVEMDGVELVADWPEDFVVGGHWSRTPEDRCEQWALSKSKKTGHLLIIPLKEESVVDQQSEE
jgi:hypothetical protein